MDDREERLSKLIEEVRQHPKKSLNWRKAMNKLLIEIQQLPGLTKSSHPDYGEALDDTLLKLGDEIQQFEPKYSSIETSLVAWINVKLRLKYKVQELYSPNSTRSAIDPKTAKTEFRQQARKTPLSLDAPINSENSTTFGEQIPASGARDLWELQEQIEIEQQKLKNSRIGLELKEYIEQDPEGKLRRCHPAAHPQCNCQILSLRLLLKHPPDRLSRVAKDLKINYHTLNWHWKNKGLPLLRSLALDLGYQPND
ncbi:MAG: hypothetical protein QNJ54_27000 [Prochloraceae cyanobacterium]|nr:hypothetical protein [Prochloraceae cyanobacterium]